LELGVARMNMVAEGIVEYISYEVFETAIFQLNGRDEQSTTESESTRTSALGLLSSVVFQVLLYGERERLLKR
jgi:hypothetical protein